MPVDQKPLGALVSSPQPLLSPRSLVPAHSSEHSSDSSAPCELQVLSLQRESESVSLQVQEEEARVLWVLGCTSVEASGGFRVTCKVITGWLCLCGAGTRRKGTGGGSAVQKVYLLPHPKCPLPFLSAKPPHLAHSPLTPTAPPCPTPQSTPSPLPPSQLCLTRPTQSS